MLVVVVVVVVVGYLVQCSSGQRQAREAPITLERKITPAGGKANKKQQIKNTHFLVPR